MVSADRKYLKSHEWVKIEGSTAVIGISDHAQDALGDITFVDLPKVGSSLIKGKECGVIESVKAASDIYAPLSGKVTAVNTALTTAPEAINTDPYGEGWMIKIDGVNAAEAADLLEAQAYEEFLKTEE